VNRAKLRRAGKVMAVTLALWLVSYVHGWAAALAGTKTVVEWCDNVSTATFLVGCFVLLIGGPLGAMMDVNTEDTP
jgi:hypothetical protein